MRVRRAAIEDRAFSPRRIAVSIARMIRGFIRGVRSAITCRKQGGLSSPAFKRRLRPPRNLGTSDQLHRVAGPTRGPTRGSRSSMAWDTVLSSRTTVAGATLLRRLVLDRSQTSALGQLGERSGDSWGSAIIELIRDAFGHCPTLCQVSPQRSIASGVLGASFSSPRQVACQRPSQTGWLLLRGPCAQRWCVRFRV